MSGHFLSNGKSFPIQAKPGSAEQAIEVILSPGLAKKYVVEKKDIPKGIPTSWRDDASQKTYKIKWLNNFGLKPIGKPDFVPGKVSEKYELLVEAGEGETLFYYDEGVKRFPPGDLERPGNMPGKLAARLDLGDPVIGRG
ncbi:MAG: hypothetical protein JSV61_07250 [Anaerolineales bacterium]|nr:MAG: hypothetical protein JSV61_07250 [Anaerolineales bacterium]